MTKDENTTRAIDTFCQAQTYKRFDPREAKHDLLTYIEILFFDVHEIISTIALVTKVEPLHDLFVVPEGLDPILSYDVTVMYCHNHKPGFDGTIGSFFFSGQNQIVHELRISTEEEIMNGLPLFQRIKVENNEEEKEKWPNILTMTF